MQNWKRNAKCALVLGLLILTPQIYAVEYQYQGQGQSSSSGTSGQMGFDGAKALTALAGALTANKVANNSGNTAAITTTQNNLTNAEASTISSGVTSALTALINSSTSTPKTP